MRKAALALAGLASLGLIMAPGCSGPPATEAPAGGDVAFVLQRANVTVFPIEWSGRLTAALETLGWEGDPQRKVSMPGTLLWHANLTFDWESAQPATSTPRMALFAVAGCGADCTRLRLVAEATGGPPARLEVRDWAPEPGDAGLVVRVWQDWGLLGQGGQTHFQVTGSLVSLRPDTQAAPILLDSEGRPVESQPAP